MGRSLSAGRPPKLPGGQALAADLDNLGFQINKDNVREVYQLLAQETTRPQTVMDNNGFKLKVDDCGTDPVSPEAAEVFTAKLTKLKAQCNAYVTALDNAARQLLASAQLYGLTEDQVKSSLTAIPAEPQAAPSLARPLLPGPGNINPTGSVAKMPNVFTPLTNRRPSLPGPPAGPH